MIDLLAVEKTLHDLKEELCKEIYEEVSKKDEITFEPGTLYWSPPIMEGSYSIEGLSYNHLSQSIIINTFNENDENYTFELDDLKKSYIEEIIKVLECVRS